MEVLRSDCWRKNDHGVWVKEEQCSTCLSLLRITLADVVVIPLKWSRETGNEGNYIYHDISCPICGHMTPLTGKIPRETFIELRSLNPEAYAPA